MLAVLRRRRGTAADLARLLACWLVAILLAQGLAATFTLVSGPAHRHAELALDGLGAAHALAHTVGQAHHHDEVSALAAPADGEAMLDAAALMLLATLAMLACAFAWPARRGGTAPVVSLPWPALAHVNPPPRKPPRG